MALTRAQTEYVEMAGRYWESWGQPRTAGRILGWLMISDPPEQSSGALARDLEVSAGSISTLTRQLAQVGLVDRITFPGDRASYFRLHDHVWLHVMRGRLDGVRGLHRLAEAAEAVMPIERPDRVQELRAMTEFLLEELPSLMDRLHQKLAEPGARS